MSKVHFIFLIVSSSIPRDFFFLGLMVAIRILQYKVQVVF